MNAYEQRHPNPSWIEFLAAFLCWFRAGVSADFKDCIAHLQQTSTVDEFISTFTKLWCRSPKWAESDLIPMLIDGLKLILGHNVCVMNLTSLAEAQCLTRCYETHNNALRPPIPFRDRPFQPTIFGCSSFSLYQSPLPSMATVLHPPRPPFLTPSHR